MDLRQEILELIAQNKEVRTRELVKKYKISRQYVSRILQQLVKRGDVVKLGSVRYAYYVSPKHAQKLKLKISKRFTNRNVKEHEVLDKIEKETPLISSLKENLRSIFNYSFLEMLNNAIEHSESENVELSIEENKDLIFHIDDLGIGIFKNIMKKRGLKTELEAVQDLLKGKTTTQPQAHSGEGIFFTSKIADIFILESYGYKLTIDNLLKDIFLEELKPAKKGTRVTFKISSKSQKHLNDIFKKYQTDPTEHAFDKTEIQIRLYTLGTIHVSRSQARRVLTGLEKFKTIILDFDRVPNIGQAFADEIFRVFKNKHSEIECKPINMNEAVQFMVERVGK